MGAIVESQHFPVIIVGSGIAGLLTALKLSEAGIYSVVATKTRLRENSSWMAQGGIAAVLPENTQDSLELHVQDTLYAGAGLADEAVTRSILSEGHLAIQDLLALGVPFDRVGNQLAFTKEAAHSTQRILHAGGDATGRSIQATLIDKVLHNSHITLLEDCIALNLIMENGYCKGVQTVCYDENLPPKPLDLWGHHIILATGGIGRLYAQTTNPAIATGDGVALAYTAGAKIQDMEFVQFHPTAFWADGQVRFLISEALRGEGGILRDKSGRAFAHDYHPQGELAPRDIVTRSIAAQMLKDERSFVTLDITHLPVATIEQRFPTILEACLQFGVDIRTDQIPVAPAAHYGMGGVQVDTHGKTTLDKLYAVGEVVSSGLHGANRLASNSLLECVVLARRVASQIAADTQNTSAPTAETATLPVPVLQAGHPEWLSEAIQHLRDSMWQHAGILRNAAGLEQALLDITQLETLMHKNQGFYYVPHGVEFRDMLITSRLIVESALERTESRGAHSRTDFTKAHPSAEHSILQQKISVKIPQLQTSGAQ